MAFHLYCYSIWIIISDSHCCANTQQSAELLSTTCCDIPPKYNAGNIRGSIKACMKCRGKLVISSICFLHLLSSQIMLQFSSQLQAIYSRLLFSGTHFLSRSVHLSSYDGHSTDVYVNKSSVDLCPQQTHRIHPTREGNLSMHSTRCLRSAQDRE